MNRRRFLKSTSGLFLPALPALIFPKPLRAQVGLPFPGPGMPAASGGGGYTGPGDVVSGALAWWGLRAYTLASIGNNCVTIQRASDNATQTFVTVAGGGVDLASIATFLAATTGKIISFIDQTGNGNHAVSVFGTAASFTTGVIGSLPGGTFTTGTTQATSGAISSSAQPFSTSSVFKCTLGNAGADQGVIGQQGVSWTAGISNVNLARTYAGSGVTATATDNVFHAMQNVFNNASSHIYVDGADTSGTAGTQGLSATGLLMGKSTFGGMAGVICEVGIWASKAFSGTEMGNLNSNQHAYWGF
jgi:hypothetical protein